MKCQPVARLFLSTLSLRRATWRNDARHRTYQLFLSTLSLRRATPSISTPKPGKVISIHALLAESDCGCFARCRFWAYFYPRSPCGERRKIRYVAPDVSSISIHALLAESDIKFVNLRVVDESFLSTLSLRRATTNVVSSAGTIGFLSTLSLRRATLATW